MMYVTYSTPVGPRRAQVRAPLDGTTDLVTVPDGVRIPATMVHYGSIAHVCGDCGGFSARGYSAIDHRAWC